MTRVQAPPWPSSCCKAVTRTRRASAQSQSRIPYSPTSAFLPISAVIRNRVRARPSAAGGTMTIERVLATTPETRRPSPTGGIVRAGMRKYFTHLDPVVPVHHPRVLVETAAAQGADRAQLLENVGISEATLSSPEARISYHQYGILTSNALRLTNNSALGLEYGRNIRAAQMGPLGLALMNSPNLGAAIEALLRHSHSLLPAFDLDLRVEGERAILSATETLSLDPFRTFSTEVVLASIDVQIRSIVGNAWALRAVR